MGLRETQRSLRWWFGLVGGAMLVNAFQECFAGGYKDPGAIAAIALGVVFGAAYLYFAARLPGLLEESPRRIVNTISANAVIIWNGGRT